MQIYAVSDIPSKVNASPFKLFDSPMFSSENRLIVSRVFPTSARSDYTKIAERTVRGLIISQRCENFLLDSRFDFPFPPKPFNLIKFSSTISSLSFDLHTRENVTNFENGNHHFFDDIFNLFIYAIIIIFERTLNNIKQERHKSNKIFVSSKVRNCLNKVEQSEQR